VVGPQTFGFAVRARILTAVGTGAFVASIYLVVVIGGGALFGRGDVEVALAVVATGLVALFFESVRRSLWRWSSRTDPDPLDRFQEGLGTAVAVDEVGPRMAELLAAATAADRVEVWLVSAETPHQQDLVGRWPPGADPIDPAKARVRSDDIRHAGQLIGRALRDGGDRGTSSPVEDRLVSVLLVHAGVALRTVLLTNQLQQKVSAREARAAELRASRQRIVATADLARHRLERDVHDGAQQHLVGLAVNLSLAAAVSRRDPSRAAGLIGDLRSAAANAVGTLEALSRGIYPKLLAESGIATALRGVFTTSLIPVTVLDQTAEAGLYGAPVGARFSTEVEAATYFTCLEAVQNAVKHADCHTVVVRLRLAEGALVLSVRDDGTGFPALPPRAGVGLGSIRDRVESLGGELVVTSTRDGGTTVCARIPAASRDKPHAADRTGDVAL
jgi:signal transduction histidine kinase